MEKNECETEKEFELKPKIFNNVTFWHKPEEEPEKACKIFYKSGWGDYCIEDVDRMPRHTEAWDYFIVVDKVEKWCYLSDLIDIIDNEKFVTGNLYIINHI